MDILEPIDRTPVEIPTRLRLPQNRTDQIRQYIREEMSRAVQSQGAETFEEADDLEPDDEEGLPYTPYEVRELEPPAPLQAAVAAPAAAPVVPAPSSEGKPSDPPPAAPNGTK